ncbi:Uncharacterised protein [uncultured archaeon]|nr:Uncharacterised protein [uncultured archaeon]
MNAKNSKRGFFFTIMAFAILSFMLLTAQVWVRTFEQQDQSASSRFKGEAMRLILFTLSDKQLSDFANASCYYATAKLDTFTSDIANGLPDRPSSDPANNGTGSVENAIKALMINGTTGPLSGGNGIKYDSNDSERYTIESWQGKIRSAANVMGFNATFSNVTNFTVRQIDAWHVGVYFEMQMNISDLDGTMFQSKTLRANSSFPLQGFLDPSITRGDMGSTHRHLARNLSVEKQIFKHLNYTNASDVAPALMTDHATEGNGWFYGPITWDYPETINESELGKLSQYILVSDFNENLTQYADFYGGLIITTAPGWSTEIYTDPNNGCAYNMSTETECLNCRRTYTRLDSACPAKGEEMLTGEGYNTTTRPMIAGVSSDFTLKLPTVRRTGLTDQKFVLIDNEYKNAEDKAKGDHMVWDITKLRDMEICGFYLENTAAPSFFQRMLANPYGQKNSNLGIESFVAGQWAGGADDKYSSYANDQLSRLDWEFYGPQSGVIGTPEKIKGMPGCKSLEMCSISAVNATKEGLGKFRLSQDAIARYKLTPIKCSKYPSNMCDS